jgi:glycosyltransferase involved in cell wall biosynthesis
VLGLPKELPLAQLAIRSVIGSEYGTVLWERPGFTHAEAAAGLLNTDLLRHAWTLNKSYVGELETMLPQAVVSVAPLTLPGAFFSDVPQPRQISGPYGVYLGRFADWKGAPRLAKVWAQQIFPETGFRLVMIGLGIEPDSPGEIEVVSTARRYPDRIRLVRTMEVAVRVGLLQHASLAVFPGRYEHFPQALVETMAVGTPAVCTDIGGYAPLAQHGRTALVIDTDLYGLEAAVTALAADPELCRSLAARARRLVNETFSERAAADRLATLLDSLGP